MPVERIERESPDASRLAQLQELFPEVFTDGGVDMDHLRAALEGTAADFGADDEHYGLAWPGHQTARRLGALAGSATLRPLAGEGVDEASTQNLLLVGDNLEILRLLQKSYARRVKLIYIDPPYNTGEDFVYKDKFAVDLELYLLDTRQADLHGRLTSNPKSSGRFHSNWLNFMYPRVSLARHLLRDDGFLVVSIDDAEVANLRLLLNAIMGEENFIATLVWDRNRKNDAKFFSVGHEYMLVYAKSKEKLGELDTQLRAPKEGVEEVKELFERLKAQHLSDWAKVATGLKSFLDGLAADDPRKPLARYTKVDDRGPYRDDGNINWPGGGGPTYDVIHPTTKRSCKKPRSGWRYPRPERFWEEVAAGRVVFGPDETTVPRVRSNLFESAVQVLPSVAYSYAQTAAQRFDDLFGGKRVFDNPKPFDDLARLVDYLTGPDDIVLDFFAGSGSTGHGVWLANERFATYRRFILVQLDVEVNEEVESGKNAAALGLKTIDAITKERLRRVSKQLKKENPKGDFGFRVLREDRSNVQRWVPYDGEDALTLTALFRAQNGLMAGWTTDGLLVEVMLLEGYPLDSARSPAPEFLDNVVTRVEHLSIPSRLLVCLDDQIAGATVDALAAFEHDLFVCREHALTDRTKVRIADVLNRVKTL